MSSQLKRATSTRTLLGTLVIAGLLGACGATPDQSDDSAIAGSGGNGIPIAGAGGSAAGSVSGGGAASFGTGGSSGVAGNMAVGGAIGSAGAFGTAGAVGFAGSGGSSAGAGFGGSGGQGVAGQGHGGTGSLGGSGGSGGGSVTFTQLYTQFFDNKQFASNCTGGACHNPGTQKKIDFSTQAKGYASVKAAVSKVVSEISSGGMPQGRPKWPAADLALLKAWQAEGAPNN